MGNQDPRMNNQTKALPEIFRELEQARYIAEQEGIDFVEEDEEIDTSDTFAQHLQFLEQFFRVILDGMSSDAFEALNSLVVEIYRKKGITDHSDFANMKPEEFPIFDDLYELILERIKKETN